MTLLEVLGSHSIRTAELKQVFAALRPLENGQLVCPLLANTLAVQLLSPPPPPPPPPQPTYYYRLQKALTCMAHGIRKKGLEPLYYFDVRTTGSVSCTHTCSHTYSHTFILTHTHTHTHTHTYTYSHTFILTHTHIHIYTHIHTHAHTYMYTPSHTHILLTHTQAISIPGVHHFPNSTNFSFYTWVSLDYPHTRGKVTYSDIFSSSAKKRRVLYRLVYQTLLAELQ